MWTLAAEQGAFGLFRPRPVEEQETCVCEAAGTVGAEIIRQTCLHIGLTVGLGKWDYYSASNRAST